MFTRRFNSGIAQRHNVNKTHLFFIISLVFMVLSGLSACDSKPPELMKASKQFETDQIRDEHIAHMRKNHMDELLHKRDLTMYQGIRTKKHSLKACINCHVPEQHNGKILRHTDPEHFCSTCHGYVAAQLDCFQCHVDHPNNNTQVSKVMPHDVTHKNATFDPPSAPSKKHLPSNVAELSPDLNATISSEIKDALKQSIGEINE